MADESVNVKFSADDQAVMNALNRVATGLDKVAEAGNKAGQNDSLDKLAGKWTKISKGIDLGTQAVQAFMQANREAMAQADQAARNVDKANRQFGVQAGRFLKTDHQALASVALEYGMPLAQTANVAAALASTGNAPDAVTKGGILNEMVALSVGTGAPDPADLSVGAGRFLAAYNIPKTPENYHKFAIWGANAFTKSNLQAPDLAQLSGRAAGIQGMGNLSPEDTLALYSASLEVLPGDKGATGFGNFVSSLATAKTNPNAVRGLGRIKLKPEDVDFAGEDVGTILDRLAAALDKADQVTRALAVEEIFQKEGSSPALTLINRRGAFRDLRSTIDDPQALADIVKIGKEGAYRDSIRADVRLEQAYAGRGDLAGMDQLKKLVKTSLVEQGAQPLNTMIRMNDLDIEAASMSVSPRTMAEQSLRPNLLNWGDYGRDLDNPNSELSKLLQQIEANTRKAAETREITVKAGGESAPGYSKANQAGQR